MTISLFDAYNDRAPVTVKNKLGIEDQADKLGLRLNFLDCAHAEPEDILGFPHGTKAPIMEDIDSVVVFDNLENALPSTQDAVNLMMTTAKYHSDLFPFLIKIEKI